MAKTTKATRHKKKQHRKGGRARKDPIKHIEK